MILKLSSKCLLAFAILFLHVSNLYAQQRTVLGKIIDKESRQPLSCVINYNKGTTTNVITA